MTAAQLAPRRARPARERGSLRPLRWSSRRSGAGKPVPARHTFADSLHGIGAGGGSPDLNSKKARAAMGRSGDVWCPLHDGFSARIILLDAPWVLASRARCSGRTRMPQAFRRVRLEDRRGDVRTLHGHSGRSHPALRSPHRRDRRRHLGLTGATRLGRRRSRRWPGRNRAARRRLASQISLLRRQPGIETAALTLARRAGADRSSAELWASRWLPAAGDEPDTRRFIIELWIVAPASVQALLNRCRPLSRWPQRLRPARGIETVLEARSRTEDPVDRTG